MRTRDGLPPGSGNEAYDFLRFHPSPQPRHRDGQVSVYADETGALKQIDPEGVESALGAGGGNAIKLFGPYDIAFDTPDITTTGLVLEAFAAGDVITEIWIQLLARFNTVNPDQNYLVVDVGTDGSQPYDSMAEFNLQGAEENTTASDVEEAQIVTSYPENIQTETIVGYASSWGRGMPVVFRRSCNAVAKVLTDGTGGLESGSARIWIHAATPL